MEEAFEYVKALVTENAAMFLLCSNNTGFCNFSVVVMVVSEFHFCMLMMRLLGICVLIERNFSNLFSTYFSLCHVALVV